MGRSRDMSGVREVRFMNAIVTRYKFNFSTSLHEPGDFRTRESHPPSESLTPNKCIYMAVTYYVNTRFCSFSRSDRGLAWYTLLTSLEVLELQR
jgi:hypothetical protein